MTEVLNLNLSSSITCHAWNKDQTQIALSPNSKDVHIYTRSGNNWQLSQTLTEHSSKVLHIDWAPQTNRIVTCSSDKNAYVWSFDGRVWKPELVVLRINRAATCVKWSPNEKKFAVGCGNRCICVCYYEPNQCFWVSKHIKKQIRSTTLCLDWHPSNSIIAAGGADFKCRLFGAHMSDVDGPMSQSIPWAAKVTPADCLAEFPTLNHGWVHSCSFGPSGNVLAYVAHDSTVYVVDAKRNPLEVISLKTSFLPFLSLKFVSDSTFLAVGHDCYPVAFAIKNNTISVQEKLEVTPASNKPTSSNAVSTARDLFGNRDRTNTDQSTSSSVNTLHQNSITQIAEYKRNNNNVVTHVSTCGLDGNVVVWDLNQLEKQFSNLRIN